MAEEKNKNEASDFKNVENITEPSSKDLSSQLTEEKTTMPRWAWLGCVLLVIVASLHSATSPIGGGDTWVAMACGRYSLGDWCVDQPGRTWQMKLLDKFGVHITKQDPFSNESKPNEWVNQNWLTHVLFFKMQESWGFNSIVVYKFIQALLTGLFAYWAARALGVHPILAAAMVSFGILLSRSYIDLRPNISSILYAIIMIFLLARWMRGKYWSLLWLIPLMILWSNVHGGFIYAIMIFVIMLAGHLANKFFGGIWEHSWFRISWRGYIFLLLGFLVVILIPAVVSPFGLENLTHPLIVATGSDGKEWREVAEWKSIFQDGFGNVGPYFCFLFIFAVTFVAWWVLFFLKPQMPQPRGRRHRKLVESVPWPKIDLAQWGVMAITLMMSIQSRRFVFLGGVILAPFVAKLMQEIVHMICMIREHKKHPVDGIALSAMPRVVSWLLVIGSLVATVDIARRSYKSMWEDYFKPERRKMDIFWYMVGIGDQPLQAMEAFDSLQIKGTVFGRWTNGGYLAYGQTPDPETGEPPCKVFMDGRAQAAYSIDQYRKWKYINGIAGRVDAKQYDEILQKEGINAALQRKGKSGRILKALEESENWIKVYEDPRDVILLRKDDPLNQDVFTRIIKMNAERAKEKREKTNKTESR